MLATRLVVRRGGRRSTRRSTAPPAVTSKPRSRSRPSSRATATTSSSVPTASSSPDDRLPGASPASGGADNTARSPSTPHYAPSRCGTAAAVRAGAQEVQRARAQPPRAAVAVAAAERQPDRLRLLRPDRRDARGRRATGRRSLLWVIGAREGRNGGREGRPERRLRLPALRPLPRQPGRSLNASRSSLQFSFGPVPIRSLDFRGELGADGSFAPGASLYGQVTCAEVPNYSVQLRDRRRLQPRRHARLLRHLPQRRLRPEGDRQPQAEGRARRRGHAHARRRRPPTARRSPG